MTAGADALGAVGCPGQEAEDGDQRDHIKDRVEGKGEDVQQQVRQEGKQGGDGEDDQIDQGADELGKECQHRKADAGTDAGTALLLSGGFRIRGVRRPPQGPERRQRKLKT